MTPKSRSPVGVYVILVMALVAGVAATLLAGVAPGKSTAAPGALTVQFPTAIWGILFLAPFLLGVAFLVRGGTASAGGGIPGPMILSLVVLATALIFVAVVANDPGTGGSLNVIGGGTGSGGVGPGHPGSGENSSNSSSPNGSTGSGGSTGNGSSNSSGNHSGNGTGGNRTGNGTGGNSSGGGAGNGTNGTGNHSTGGGSSGGKSGGGSGAGPAAAFSVNLPGWVPFAVIGVVSACVAVVAIPGLSTRIGRRGSESGLGGAGLVPRQAVRADLARASAEIEEGVDPRVAIVRLYARLLARVEPIVGELGSRTAEEIRSIYLAQPGVRPEASEALTRLFEEARYSAHPMGPEAAERARRAIGLVEADLSAAPPKSYERRTPQGPEVRRAVEPGVRPG